MTYYHIDIAGNVIDSEGNSTRSVLNQSSQWQLVGINLHRASKATAWKKSTCLYACIWVHWYESIWVFTDLKLEKMV